MLKSKFYSPFPPVAFKVNFRPSSFLLGRSSRLDRAAITINITAITITATVATATAVCFSNNGFPVVVGVAAVCESAFAPEVSWFVVDTVVVDDNIVEDVIVDDEFVANVVVSAVDV